MGKRHCLLDFCMVIISLQFYKCLSETFTVAYFDANCWHEPHTHVDTLVNLTLHVNTVLNSTMDDSNHFEYLTFHVCGTENIDERELYEVFQNSSISAYVGPVNYTVDKLLVKYARLFHRPYVSAFSPLPHYDNQQIYSVGSGFEQTAVAVVTIMNHFQWKNILVITSSEDEHWMELGNVLFIYLSSDKFIPSIKYLSPQPENEEILEILDNTKHEQKGILLCTDLQLRIRILELAAVKNIQIHHAFFTFVMSPYVLHAEDSRALQSGNHKEILESIFEIHPDFRQENNETELLCNVGEVCTLEERFLLDSVILLDYAFRSVTKSTSIGKPRIFGSLRNRTLNIYSGTILTDIRNEIMYNFILYDYDAVQMKYVKIQEVIQSNAGVWKLLGLAEVQWPSGIILPPDECFHPESCDEQQGLDAFYILAIAISVLVVVGVAIAVVITIWRNVIKKEMLKGHHKVLLTSQDLVFLQRKDVMKGSKMISTAAIPEKPDLLKASEKPNRSMASLHEYSDITDTARYNGDLVHVKELKVKGFEIKSKVLNIVKTLREIRHENVNAIIGCFEDPPNSFIISDYCSRGSLEDVIKNTDIKLDWDFKVSLLTDLIRGIRFIHNSAIHYHGNLKWQNCLIDSRWVLKVTDFGLPSIYEASKCTPVYEDKDLLFTAPEHLRTPNPLMKGSEKGDVYSIAIIMQSVVLRSDPYCTCGLTSKEIIHKLRHPPPLLRPSVSQQAAPPQYIQIMKICWSENPDMRPTVEDIYQQYKTITGGKKMNIVDTMFRMLEKYSTDLEDLVRERTIQLEDEKKKTDTLLYRMLPPIVADSLKIGNAVKAEQFSEVTIYFSDIVGFTTISAMSTPMEVVDLLNDLYTMFDAVIDNFDVYKVETIGDAYMVVSGLPVKNGNRHAGEISTMALELLSHCGNFVIKHMPEVPLRVRIGLHSGSCVAGVVGLTMPRYCLFGDTVNTASRMESTGAPYRIHISEDVKSFLEVLGGYEIEYRGEVELKGKGIFRTYWLTGKDGYSKPLPEPPPINGTDTHGLSKTDREAFAQNRKISTNIPNRDNEDLDTYKGQNSTTDGTKAQNQLPKSITNAISQEAGTVMPVVSKELSAGVSSVNNEKHLSNPCNNNADDEVPKHQTDFKTETIHKLSSGTNSVKKESSESNTYSFSKSNSSGLSDMSDSKVSSSAVHVSGLYRGSSSSIGLSDDNSPVNVGTGALDETATLLESKSLQKQVSNNVKHTKMSGTKTDNNNDRYFQEIETYFKEEKELPYNTNLPKSYKAKDSLKIKRSQNPQGGSTAYSSQKDKRDSKINSDLHSESTTTLADVELTGQTKSDESISKRKAFTKKGSRHKVYDNLIQVGEYKKADNFVMHPKPKLRERVLSDIPSSRLCTPEAESNSQDSVIDDSKQTDADKISLKLPNSETLV